MKKIEPISKDKLYQEYIVKQKSMPQIGQEVGCSPCTISRWLDEYSIPSRQGQELILARDGNLAGKRIGELEVLFKSDIITKDGRRQYIVKCHKCNTTIKMFGKHILNYKGSACRKCDKGKRFKGFNDIDASYWTAIIRGARNRLIDFNITIEEAWNLYLRQNKKCALTGQELFFRKNGKSGNASLDRIDSTNRQYIINNVQWVHKDVNKIKQNLDENKFIELCCLIAKYKRGLK